MTDVPADLDLLSDPHALYTPKEAGDFLRVSQQALALWRQTGDGPPYARLGRTAIRYRRKELLAYVESRVATSTAAEQERRRR